MINKFNEIILQAREFRRALHQQPELSWQEVHTAQKIRSQLDLLNIPWRSCATNGTVASLAKNAKGEHIALRCDIDALPILEEGDASRISQVPGCMHACGHDGHSAALWATAAWLKMHEALLPGPVSLLFQPAEEGGHGAREMISHGALQGVDLIYGWHNWPQIAFAQGVCPEGVVMAGNANFYIDLKGRGGHASQPENCADPVIAAAAITLNLQQIVSRKLPPQSSVVVGVSSIDARSMETVIPETAQLAGSIRYSDASLAQPINQLISQIAMDTAAGYGVQASTRIEAKYGVTKNHSLAAKTFQKALADEFGQAWQASQLALPVMGSEDFSYYLNEIPGAYALLGMAQNNRYQQSLHSPHYEFNDDLLAPVVRILSRLVNAPLP